MILAVTGGKGGVGKSTVAYNLGAEIDAVVVDADLGMADLPTPRGPDLHDVLAGRAAPHEAVDDSGDVTLVPCGRSLNGARAADPTTLGSVGRALEAEFGAVVIDCPAGLASDAGLPLYVADCCLIVTTAAPTALADGLRTRALARKLDAGLCGVALNRSGEGAPTDRVARLFGAPVVSLPETDAAQVALDAAIAVKTVESNGTFARQMNNLAQLVHSCKA
ncbi:MinD/ParA family ATP-binding protein [Haladaptatus sp. CMSO5]|uniref:MinD/ParA family ATP-binding protein n=1 Tax=Haladaptatus sp. CMSO5 TaxID=3120514 RepID=UPI002FCDE210